MLARRSERRGKDSSGLVKIADGNVLFCGLINDLRNFFALFQLAQVGLYLATVGW